MKFIKKIFLNDYVFCSIFVASLLFLISVIPVDHALTQPFSDALNDFEITDLAFTKLRVTEPEGDSNIVIVNTGKMDHAQLAALIEIINNNSPAVIGINKVLRKSDDSFADSLLRSALGKVKTLVCAGNAVDLRHEVMEWKGIQSSDSIFTTFTDKVQKGGGKCAKLGFLNMPTGERDFKTTRDFFPSGIIEGRRVYFFPVELVRVFDLPKANAFLSRNKPNEIINYRGNMNKFTTLDGEQILNSEFHPPLITNKIILLGYLGETLNAFKFWDEKKYYTPLNDKYAGKAFPDMFETVIYANIASQILYGQNINKLDPGLELALNLFICLLNVIMFSLLFSAAAIWWDTMSLVISLIEVTILLLSTALVLSRFGLDINLNLSIVFILVLSSFLELYYGFFKIIIIKYFLPQKGLVLS